MIAEKIFIGKIPVVIYKPIGFDASKKYPVVLFGHGKGEMGSGSEADLTVKILNSTNQGNLVKRADQYQFIIVAPQLVQAYNDWIPGWTDKYLMPVYDYILTKLPTDLNHIKVTGLSLGGGMSWIVATNSFAKYVSAVVPICGTPEYQNCDYSAIAKYNIALWAFHAKDDSTVNYAATVNQINSVKKYNPIPEPKMTLFDTGNHWIWGRVYDDDSLYKWMFAQQNDIVIPVEPIPAPTPFKPSHVIIRPDGTKEQVRIETL